MSKTVLTESFDVTRNGVDWDVHCSVSYNGKQYTIDVHVKEKTGWFKTGEKYNDRTVVNTQQDIENGIQDVLDSLFEFDEEVRTARELDVTVE